MMTSNNMNNINTNSPASPSLERVGHLMLMRSKEGRHDNVLLWLSLPRISRNPHFWRLTQYPASTIATLDETDERTKNINNINNNSSHHQLDNFQQSDAVKSSWTNQHVAALRAAIVSAILHSLATQAHRAENEQNRMDINEQIAAGGNNDNNNSKSKSKSATPAPKNPNNNNNNNTQNNNKTQNNNNVNNNKFITCSQISLGGDQQQQEQNAGNANNNINNLNVNLRSESRAAPAPLNPETGLPTLETMERRLERDMMRIDRQRLISRLFKQLDLFALLHPLAEKRIEEREKREKEAQEEEEEKAKNEKAGGKKTDNKEDDQQQQPPQQQLSNIEKQQDECLRILQALIEVKPENVDLLELAAMLKFDEDYDKISGRRRDRQGKIIDSDESETDLENDYIPPELEQHQQDSNKNKNNKNNSMNNNTKNQDNATVNSALRQAMLFADGGWKSAYKVEGGQTNDTTIENNNTDNNNNNTQDDDDNNNNKNQNPNRFVHRDEQTTKNQILKGANKELKSMAKENRQNKNQPSTQQQQPQQHQSLVSQLGLSTNYQATSENLGGGGAGGQTTTTYDDWDDVEVPMSTTAINNNIRAVAQQQLQRGAQRQQQQQQRHQQNYNNNNNNNMMMMMGNNNNNDDLDDDDDGWTDEVNVVPRNNNNYNQQQQQQQPKRKRQAWTAEEDAAILEGVQKFHGATRFTDMFKYFQEVWKDGRTATHLSDHYRNVLSKRVFS